MPSSIRGRNLKYTRQVCLARPAAHAVYAMREADGRTSCALPQSKTEGEIVLLRVSVRPIPVCPFLSSFFSYVFRYTQVTSVRSNA